MIREVLVSDDGVTRVVDVYDGDEYLHRAETVLNSPAADPDVTELAAALANLPTDTLAALRAALGIA